uniref:Apple domain-containing protein n=1 Tax=Panagrellus redivivus TaxID=6233 RepID=A0A7E4UYA1_PANRE
MHSQLDRENMRQQVPSPSCENAPRSRRVITTSVRAAANTFSRSSCENVCLARSCDADVGIGFLVNGF